MYSVVSYTGNGVLTDFVIPFPYLDTAHVEGSVNGVARGFTWVNPSTVRFSPAPAGGQAVVLRRDSNRMARLVDFQDSANLTENVLDMDSDQLMYLIQEAFDQATNAAYFTSDAGGARVTNVADPILNTDAATKGWVAAYISALGIGVGGGDLLPLNNTWTGTNLFNNTVSVKGAVFNGVDVAVRSLLRLNTGLYVQQATNSVTEPLYGLILEVSRSSGNPFMSGLNMAAMAKSTFAGALYGGQFGAWRAAGSTGNTFASQAGVFSTNGNDSVSQRVGLDLLFHNRETGYTVGGDSPNQLGQSGAGTVGNYYNNNSWAMQFSGQDRSDGGTTYSAWNRGIRALPYAFDLMKPTPFSGSVPYIEGDYVSYGGHVYICTQATTAGVLPTDATHWQDYGAGATVKAVGIDFGGVGQTTADRMLCALRLRDGMEIHYDSESLTYTNFTPQTARWNMGVWTADHVSKVNRFGIDVSTGDLYINEVNRYLATRSSVSAHRNGSGFALGGGATWNTIPCPTRERDDRNEYNTSTGAFRPNTPGDYLFSLQIQTAGVAAGDGIAVGLMLNGVNYKASSTVTATGVNQAHLTCVVRMNGTTDSAAMAGYWTGSSVSISGDPADTFFQVTKVQ